MNSLNLKTAMAFENVQCQITQLLIRRSVNFVLAQHFCAYSRYILYEH